MSVCVTQSIAASDSAPLNGPSFCGFSTASRDDPSIHLSLFVVFLQCAWAVSICTKIYRPTVFKATVRYVAVAQYALLSRKLCVSSLIAV